MDFTRQNWSSGDYNILVDYLNSLAEKKYKEFTQKLNAGDEYVIGVRLPKIREVAKQIAKGNFEEYICICSPKSHEEKLLLGLVIGYAKTPLERSLKMAQNFVPQITNWAICDSFCSNFKTARVNKNEIFEFLKQYLYSENEFEVRFAVVMLLEYFIEEAYLDEVFEIFDSIIHQGYYVKMAVAWAVSVCFVRFEDKTLRYLENCGLDKFTYNKALQKIIESYRVSQGTKEIIRAKKRA